MKQASEKEVKNGENFVTTVAFCSDEKYGYEVHYNEEKSKMLY